MKHADEWKEQVTSLFAGKREVKTTVIDVNGKAVFVTRYFKALKPPEELTNKGLPAEATAVSLYGNRFFLLHKPYLIK